MPSVSHNNQGITPLQEAKRIYTALFREPVPNVIAERFARASLRLDENTATKELQEYRYAIENIADLEALEIASRLTKGPGILSRKFHLMVYLAETIPQNRAIYIKDNDATVNAYAIIISGALRTFRKALKGLILLQRLDNA